ncbi:hypothetical protein VTK73DRAFT_4735 [Phialemonium thermophilum]|uniref:Uncharacterized protein n=1 Tax=Phialemonium thermophilum TaxID=223376 RepID=A0ABR3WSL6_9PEZI
MDPLSITTGILAILSAAGGIAKTIEKIRDLRNAPKELKHLLGETRLVQRSLQGVLDVLNNSLDEPNAVELSLSASGIGGTAEALSQALGEAQRELDHLDALLQASIRPLPSASLSLVVPSAFDGIAADNGVTAEFKVDFLTYSRNRPKIKAAREALQAARSHISLCLGSLNVKVTVERTKAVQRQVNVATAALALNQAELYAAVEENSRLLQQLLVSSSISLHNSTEPAPTTSRITQHPTPETMMNLLTAEKKEAALLPLSLSRAPRCPIWCTCVCHQKLHVSSLQPLEPVTGSTHVALAGGWLSKPCSDPSCKRRETAGMQLNYFPPAWAWSRMVRLSVALNPLTGLQISMKTPRLVSGSHRIFHFALGGNVDALRKAFVDGQGSPFDVDGRTGSSLLHLAALNRHAALFSALLDAGADPHQEDKQKRTPADIVWDRALQDMGDTSPWKMITSREEMDDLETRRFSSLHKVVLGLTPLPLADYLTVISCNEVDALDTQGRTPLSWACARGDVASVEALLAAGADVGAACWRTGMTPLHFAVEKGSVPCVIALLRAGADVDAVAAGGRSVLHIAAMAETDAEEDGLGFTMFDALREHAPDVEVRDATGATPLLVAAGQGNSQAVTFLLAAGADVETEDDWGYTPFLQALCYNHVDIMNVLLDKGADYRKVTTTSYAMTHLVAHYASIETMKSLTRRRLRGVDPNERNGKGLTSRDILELARPGAGAGLCSAFEEFLQSLELGDDIEESTEVALLEGVVDDVERTVEVAAELM